MRIRLEPEDDYLHPVEEASNFNESRYYNWFDLGEQMGGWVRMGNRPNEGYAEMTVCLYLPDGRVGFNFKRPHIEGHTAHDAGGLRFEVVAPYEKHRITYEGKVCVLTEPREMGDPRTAFENNPFEPCQIDLALEAVGKPWGGEPEWEEGEDKPDLDPEKLFARGHTEQHMRSTGTVRIGDETFEITDGLGLRDHSWGPRFWQNVWWYRWLTVNLGPDLGFACTVSGNEAGDRNGARLPLRRRALRRRAVGADPQGRALVRLRQGVVSRPRTRPSSPPTTTCTKSTETCGRTSRCATGAPGW